MNWSNYGKWRHPKEWWELKQKTNNMDKVTEQLIRIEAKLELIIDMVKAKNKTNKESKEPISYVEWHKRRDEMAKQQEENKSK
jgi:hypothetical protein